ncbi:hypothetical protein [Tateyamaria sp. SN3-11]|uniref:hypothetical protein n=1 Tax=Tateyamaria sp. SN3-11 TaxID=3092147 RepID=UPI0039E79DFA
MLQDGMVHDWGTTERLARKAEDMQAFLRNLIAGYNPDVVVTESVAKGCMKRLGTQVLIEALASEAAEHEVLDISAPIPRAYPSRFERAVALAERHPALRGYLPKRRPHFYENTPRGYLLFDAVALAEAALTGPPKDQ